MMIKLIKFQNEKAKRRKFNKHKLWIEMLKIWSERVIKINQKTSIKVTLIRNKLQLINLSKLENKRKKQSKKSLLHLRLDLKEVPVKSNHLHQKFRTFFCMKNINPKIWMNVRSTRKRRMNLSTLWQTNKWKLQSFEALLDVVKML